MAGGQLVLLGKPFGGVVGVPGSVLGYLVLTAALLGLATASLCVWRVRPSLEIASASGILAGLAILVAGVAHAVAVFTAAVLLAGAATGPLLVTGRALAADLGRASSVFGNAAAMAGVAAAAWLGSRYYEEPGAGLIIAGVLSAVWGAAAGLLGLGRADPRPGRRMGFVVPARSILLGYAQIGLVVGGTVLPALHLLLFRWNEFGAEQLRWLLLAAIPAVAVIALPAPRQAAVPVLVVLAAGGALLVATAPGPVTLTIGLAVTMLAAARAVAALDEAVRIDLPPIDRGVAVAVAAIVVAIAATAGLGLADLLGRLVGTGSMLCVLGCCVLITVWPSGRLNRRPRPGTRGPTIERGRP